MRQLVVWLVLIVSVSACGGSAAPARNAFVEQQPRPEEPLVMKTGDVGTHGGRFVMALTSSPQTFNPIISSTTYSGDVAERLFVQLTTLALDTQEMVPALATHWMCRRCAVLHVPPAARAKFLTGIRLRPRMSRLRLRPSTIRRWRPITATCGSWTECRSRSNP